MATVYASNHPVMKKGDSCPPDRFENGVTNGAFWYNVKGYYLLLRRVIFNAM